MSGVAGLPPNAVYQLRLVIAGNTDRSRRAIENLRQACRQYLGNTADIEIIDIYQQPDRAKDYDVVAAPTLVKLLPLPVRRIVGDLSRQDRLL
jgi:circadian clock protein KaiB